MAGKFSHDTFQYLEDLKTKKGKEIFKTFVRGDKLSMGIQLLRKGDDYGEPAHKNGEVYYIVKGHATLMIGKKNYEVSPGMAMHIPPKVHHRFYNVKKELVFLFIFGGLDD
ncbi:MAG TPA: cupin domain-containing protein [Nitrosopumilaceae archaeon]|nr:cupin domain-containing protein [Nitrosopumilaceae archaeon]